MPKWLKIVLGILIASVVICGGIFGACALYVKGKVEDSAGGIEEAKKFGATHDSAQCVEESIARAKKCGDVKSVSGALCLTNAHLYFQACLDATSDKEAMCKGVPEKSDEIDQWVDARCKETGMELELCKGFLGQVIVRCMKAPPTEGDGAPTEEPPPPEQPAGEQPPAE